MASLDRLISELEDAKPEFGGSAARRALKLLEQIERRVIDDAELLIRFHEALLFIRSHPHSEEVLRKSDELLTSFAERVKHIRSRRGDLVLFDYIENSGIAATELSGTFSYGIARWLVNCYPDKVDIDWERWEKKERLAFVLAQLLPLFYEDSLVEANVPHRAWLDAAKKNEGRDLEWLIRRIEQLPLSERRKAELYDSLELYIRWDLNDSRASRTRNIRATRNIYYHSEPLIRRSDVSLEKIILSPPLKLKKLSRAEGERAVDMLRATTTVRYRELYGITNGNPENVVRANVGRGVEIFLWDLPAKRRLPLRAYHAGFTLKNGVPINYIEGITIFERMELGFNTFYTFREGESAWVYAQVLRLLHNVVGATAFSIDPYQIGFNNDEAIESGAFWFYRKLGFRPVKSELAQLAAREEKKIAADRGYKTPARVLKRLSKGHIIYELPGTTPGDWDRFEMRNVALAVERRMAEEFSGRRDLIEEASSKKIARALSVELNEFDEAGRAAFENLSLVLALVPDLDEWSDGEKRAAVEIIRAKAAAGESLYARLLQQHARLREAIIKLGSWGNDE
jgi:hypothetical protein